MLFIVIHFSGRESQILTVATPSGSFAGKEDSVSETSSLQSQSSQSQASTHITSGFKVSAKADSAPNLVSSTSQHFLEKQKIVPLQEPDVIASTKNSSNNGKSLDSIAEACVPIAPPRKKKKGNMKTPHSITVSMSYDKFQNFCNR